MIMLGPQVHKYAPTRDVLSIAILHLGVCRNFRGGLAIEGCCK